MPNDPSFPAPCRAVCSAPSKLTARSTMRCHTCCGGRASSAPAVSTLVIHWSNLVRSSLCDVRILLPLSHLKPADSKEALVVLTQPAGMWYNLIRLNATRYGAYRVSRNGKRRGKPIPADRAAATARSVCVPPNPKAGRCPAFLCYRSPLGKISLNGDMSL